MAARKFEFEVRDDETFDFSPDEWEYETDDTVTFASKSGPFEIHMLPIDPLSGTLQPGNGDFSPFVGFQHGQKIKIKSTSQANGEFRSDTFSLRDPRTDTDLAPVFAANNNQFLAQYRYAILVVKDDKPLLNTEHNGEWQHD